MRTSQVVRDWGRGAVLAGLLGAAGSVMSTTLPPDVDTTRPPVYDRELGVPRLVWGKSSRSPAPRPHAIVQRAVSEARARELLGRLAPLYALDQRALTGVQLAEWRADGQRLARFIQRIGGVPVLDRELNLLLDADDQLVLATGNLSPHVPRHGFDVPADEAVRAAWRGLTGVAAAPRTIALERPGEWLWFEVEAVAGWRAVTPARARAVYHAGPDGLFSAWQVELMLRDAAGTERAHELRIDAIDASVISQRSLLAHARHTYEVWADAGGSKLPQAGPQGSGWYPHPTGAPEGGQMIPVARSLVALDASPYRPDAPWLLLPDSSTLAGERVVAYADRDGGGLCLPCGSDLIAEASAGQFRAVWDSSAAADASDEQVRATLIQAFYVTNHLSDWFYGGGFDEPSGNHQRDNRGRGGVGGDPLLVETLDADTPDNANAMVPDDGSSPRIQLGAVRSERTRGIEAAGDAGFSLVREDASVGFALFGASRFDLTAELVAPQAAGGAGPHDLCSPVAAPSALVGKIALVARGGCFFSVKTLHAEQAGAVGVVVHNDVPTGSVGGGILTMAAVVGVEPSIPALLVTAEDGASLRAARGVLLRMRRDSFLSVDGAADSSLVAHEWGHVLSGRLVRTDAPDRPCNVGTCQPIGPQPQGLDEGFADFIALLYLTREETGAARYQGSYAFAGWMWGGSGVRETGAPDFAYFGWRRYPYSVDMSRNPLTFGHIAADAELPAGVPVGFNPGMTTTHSVGEVWAVTLWDAYVGMQLSGGAGFAATRDRMRDHVVATLKLLPDNPTFIEARDVMLTVVGSRSSRDHAAFAAAFAKRGLGRDALGPALDDPLNSGIQESFTPVETPITEREGGGGALVWSVLLLALAGRRLRRHPRPSAAVSD